MRDRDAIFKLLGVSPKELFINEVNLNLDLTCILDCLYDLEEQKPFKIMFRECERIQFDRLEELIDNSPADIGSIRMDLDRKPHQITIHTVTIEINIVCNQIEIEKSWQ